MNGSAPKADVEATPERGEASGRPTSIPDIDVAALAAGTFPHPPPSSLPLDLAVPIRRRASSVDGAPLRAAFLLSHVDDRQTVAEIAACAQIPLDDALACFELLEDLGVVELRGPNASPPTVRPESDRRPPTKSGLRPKT